ncbi:OPT/YSL family transporter [Paracoccus fistulariae]|uniref:OPT/YSL family transporter n=1 Tax=Paracoccus fistulariae TaxID=658446 RepID=A0ABY7SFY3_9RHOB|nr:OPT/YSL family transporter [Paracoccus fistulariae]MDB6181783.1 OPT/YSL family transporter [Paracoccus fistulariae]WCR05924.1 OPT/YSL family transporter [Paracoccus fistulariae]
MSTTEEEGTALGGAAAAGSRKHPKTLELVVVIPIVLLSALGAIVGMQLIVTLGISANTSIIGALIAMVFARLPIAVLHRFRAIDRQNLLQSAVSSATFGAANSLMIPIGVPFVMGMPELIVPMLIGATLAMFIDGTMLYGLFNTKAFPATGTWPAGVATAETLWAGDQGGRKAVYLGIGIAGGVGGSMLGIPMSAAGVAFIGNIWALSMFGLGLLMRGYADPVFGIDINAMYLPHGFMIGAGIVALYQVGRQISAIRKDTAATANGEASEDPEDRAMKKFLFGGFGAYILVALLLTMLAGVTSTMSLPMLLGFLLFAAIAAYVHELIVGIAAMHSGWFPAFAVALITLIIGILVGFPPAALGLLVGYSAATGPAFADMGYDLKTGYMIRGENSDPAYEREGRRQQYYAALIGFLVAAIVVAVSYQSFFSQDLVPPVDRVYASTIAAGASPEIAMQLLIWAIPGAILQWVGGSGKQLGVLLGTGMLINYPIAGWTVLAALAIRVGIERAFGQTRRSEMSAFAGGLIAGDALYAFFTSTLKLGK